MSGRDASSTKTLADVVNRGPASAVLVRDPVLSDNSFTDIEGKCWRQSKGAPSTMLSEANVYVLQQQQ